MFGQFAELIQAGTPASPQAEVRQADGAIAGLSMADEARIAEKATHPLPLREASQATPVQRATHRETTQLHGPTQTAKLTEKHEPEVLLPKGPSERGALRRFDLLIEVPNDELPQTSMVDAQPASVPAPMSKSPMRLRR